MNDPRETIDYYHSLLDVETARETHEQLMEHRGEYYRMVLRQAESNTANTEVWK